MWVAFGLILLLCGNSSAGAAEPPWPGAPPDCWVQERMTQGAELGDIWQGRTKFTKIKTAKPKQVNYSSNQGYYFYVEGGRPQGSVTIVAEKNYSVRIEFTELFGLSDVKWINEKLLFMRPWWGRIVGSDLIYDVEAEKIIHAETVTDSYLAYQQYRDSCPVVGCECIKKKSPQ